MKLNTFHVLFRFVGMITAVGLSNLRHVDIRKPRNMCVLGLSLLVGLALPRWVAANSSSINTGKEMSFVCMIVCLSNLLHVDICKLRNMCVLGLSLLVGLALPRWVAANSSSINTGK